MILVLSGHCLLVTILHHDVVLVARNIILSIGRSGLNYSSTDQLSPRYSVGPSHTTMVLSNNFQE